MLTTPLIAELAARGPVDVLTTPAAAGLLANHPSVRRVVVFDKRGDHRGLGGILRIARLLRGPEHAGDGVPRHAVAYLAQGSLRSAAVARLAGIPERVGFDTSAGRLLYTRQVRYRSERHHAERLWSLAAADPAARAEPARLRPRLYPGAVERAAVDALLVRHGYDGGPLLAVAPGSIWATKRWPYFAELARSLAARGRLVVIGGADDAPLAAAISAAIAGAPGGGAQRPIDATGTLSLLASAELIGRCRTLVTNDSLPQHLASAMGTPTVTVFGPTVPAFGFGPLAPRSATVGHETLDCRPCHPHGPRRCPRGHFRCMKDLPASRVEEVVASVL